MMHARKITRWLFITLAVVVVIAWLAYVFILPMFAEKQIRSAIRDVGLEGAELSVQHVGADGMQLTDVYLDKDRNNHIESVRAEYNVGDLLGSRIKTLTFTGANLGIGLRDGLLDFGPFGKIKPSPKGRIKGNLPFEKLNIQSSVLRLQLGRELWRLPVDGVITNEGERKLSVDFNTHIDVPVRIVGSIDMSQRRPKIELTLTTRSLNDAGEPSLTLQLVNEPVQSTQVWRVTSRGQWHDLEKLIAGHHLKGRDVHLDFNVAIDSTGQLHELKGTFRAEQMALDGKAVREVVFQANEQDGLATVQLAMEGPGWTLREFVLQPPTSKQTWLDGKVQIPVRIAWRGDLTDEAFETLLGEEADEGHPSSLVIDTADALMIDLDYDNTQFSASIEAVAPVLVQAGQRDMQPVSTDSRQPLEQIIAVHVSGDVRALKKTVQEQSAWEGAAELAFFTNEPVELAGLGVSAGPMRIGLESAVAQVGNQWQYHAQAVATADHIRHESGDLQFNDIRAVLPVELFAPQLDALPPVGRGNSPVRLASATQQHEFTFRVAGTRMGDTDLPGLNITITREEDHLDIAGLWPLDADAQVTLAGRIDRLTDSPQGQMHLQLPLVQLAGNPSTQAMVEGLTGMAGEGQLGFDAQVKIQGRKVSSSAQFKTSNLQLSREVEEATHRITGINTTIDFDSLLPLRSKGGQVVTFEKADFGDFSFTQGQVKLTVEQPQSVLIEELRTTVDEDRGRVWTNAFRLKADSSPIRVDLFCEDLHLDEWLRLISFDHVTGSGRLFGRIPLTIHQEPVFRVTTGAGFLYATGAGSLQLLNEQAAQRMLRDDKQGWFEMANLPDETQNRFVKALRDMVYSELRFDIRRQANGRSVLRVFAAGKGRVAPQQEIGGLTVNVNDFDQALDLAIKAKAGMEKMQDAARQNLEQE